MKHKHESNQNQQPAGATRSADVRDFSPAPAEVAEKAYFSYVNEGSESGHDVQHWLAAEAQLISEHNQPRPVLI